MFREAFASPVCDRIERHFELELSFFCGSPRSHANFCKQQGTLSFSLRHVPQHLPTMDQLELPETLLDLVRSPRGLLLVTGAAGQGKNTTACALLQFLNETMPLRVVTVEDPIEFIFEENRCQFEQCEVGVDTESFANGIRNGVRQYPEVIFIGELRDPPSIQAAMQAAETGHLVIATRHADSAPQAIDRIREFHPAAEQANASA